MDTKGNDCYMEYAFTATGVSVSILGNWDHGVYSCQIDDGSPQWFNANTAAIGYAVGCAVSGLANDKHTLKVTNAPMSGWWLTLENITLTTGDAYTGAKTFTSGWAAYQLPPTLASEAAATTVTAVTTVTASGSNGGQVPTSALAAVAAVLGALFIGAAIAAVYFWVRDSRFRRDHQWSQAITAAPVAYTTELSPPTQDGEFNIPTPSIQSPCKKHEETVLSHIDILTILFFDSRSTDLFGQRSGMKYNWGLMSNVEQEQG
ncbi:hypothetical protein M407DRAFT_32786 [Tulasnella calospora MUT 4182]|uniref:Transmembrane protein n=1 Tax=Tulasnella calospora MUT 4182 TaxID=1051891 RepID=A0A0C3Q452_9AGAM|nr:hypothetical protein M407DRAFT_32786 [Tulasnella calospora MUT 4182]